MKGIAERYEDLPPWCSPGQAAGFLGVSKRLVYKMLEEGRIPCSWRTSDHGRWNISKDGLADLVGLSIPSEDSHAV